METCSPLFLKGYNMKNILEYLEKTAATHPWNVAVDDGGVCLTWSELLDLSKSIGTAFCEKTEMQKPIVLLMEKSAVTLAAMFGAVYAGCFYVIIDPMQPSERIREILHTLSPGIVVTTKENEKLLEKAVYGKNKCLLKDIMKERIDEGVLMAVREKSRETDLLYGIFTSGSTGIPKGIVVSHKAVIDFITHFKDTFHFSDKDRIGNQAPFDFDVSVKDIYTSVMTGATLILIPKKLFSIPPALLDYLCEKKINTLIWAVSALTLVSSLKGLKYKVPITVKRVMFSGEVMPVKQLRMWQEALPEAEFVNLYGPTEITCNCLYYPVKRIFENEEKIPLGKPFAGRKVFLLGESGNEIVVAGEVGEICVAGESLAEGYYKNQKETEARFCYFMNNEQHQRYYRTGDLGYYDVYGELYFAGRKDFQIKHMGHRIELEEIECALNQIEGVEKSCCFMNQKRNRLVAFYLGDVTGEVIRTQLGKKVPSYMIPHKIIQVNQMPLNKNGKTDRNYFKNRQEVAM